MKLFQKIALGYLGFEVVLMLVHLCWGPVPVLFTFFMIILALSAIMLLWLGNGLLNRLYKYENTAYFDMLFWWALPAALLPFIYVVLLVVFR